MWKEQLWGTEEQTQSHCGSPRSESSDDHIRRGGKEKESSWGTGIKARLGVAQRNRKLGFQALHSRGRVLGAPGHRAQAIFERPFQRSSSPISHPHAINPTLSLRIGARDGRGQDQGGDSLSPSSCSSSSSRADSKQQAIMIGRVPAGQLVPPF